MRADWTVHSQGVRDELHARSISAVWFQDFMPTFTQIFPVIGWLASFRFPLS